MSGIEGISGSIISRTMGVNASPTSPAERFKELDSDGDGGLDRVELSEEAKKLSAMTGTEIDVDETIATYDADGDGLLSEDEMMSMIKEVLGPPPEMQGTSQVGPGMAPPPPIDDIFAEFDEDEDEYLSEEELTALAADFQEKTGQSIDVDESLNTYDTDSDGKLSVEELKVMMDELRPQNDSTSQQTSTVNNSDITKVLEAYLANTSDEEAASLATELLDRLSTE